MPYVNVPEDMAESVCPCPRPLVLRMPDSPAGRPMRGRHCARCGGVLTPDDLAHIDAHLQQERGEPALADPQDESVTTLRVDLDRYRLAIARTRAIITRLVDLPREPEALPDDETGRAYLRGWQDARALVDKALLPEEEG